jgi:hypothetical protein
LNDSCYGCPSRKALLAQLSRALARFKGDLLVLVKMN